MNHDISHCEGKNCPIKNVCKRYLAHLDVKRLTSGDVMLSYIEPNYNTLLNECDMYMEMPNVN